MKIFFIVILSLFCIIIMFRLAVQRKRLDQILDSLRSANNDRENKKIYVKESGIVSKVALEINELINKQNDEFLRHKKLEQANKELLTSLSHDVRTPIASLLGYLDALESDMVSGEEKDEYIRIARKKAYDLKRLVDSLFDWFKIDSNELKLSKEKTDICELTKEIVIDWLPVLEQNGIIPIIEIPDEEWFAELDISAYKRILSNLIQNSIEHSNCQNIYISVKQGNGLLNAIIKDDGQGISKEKLPHIFERLYKGDTSRSRQSSGLGLSIVKELAKMHGGSIIVKSSTGEYTEFNIELPIYKR